MENSRILGLCQCMDPWHGAIPDSEMAEGHAKHYNWLLFFLWALPIFHVTLLQKELHWLPTGFSVQFLVLALSFKTLDSLGLGYQKDPSSLSTFPCAVLYRRGFADGAFS